MGGSIAASATGGVGSKSFSILPFSTPVSGSTYTRLAAGTYTLTATDSRGCTLTSTVTLIQTMLKESNITLNNYPILVQVYTYLSAQLKTRKS